MDKRLSWLAAALIAAGCHAHGGYAPHQPARATFGARNARGGEQTNAPGRIHNTEAYDKIDENPFLSAARHPLSTFSVDVDSASYSNVRRFLAAGRLPPKDAVRVEELINYFNYDYPQPRGDSPFSVVTEVSTAPWRPGHVLVHIGLQGRRLSAKQLPPRNLVFLLDVSGSMAAANKLPLLRRAMRLLVNQLTERDTVSIVVYAGASGLVLPPTSGGQKAKIRAALDRLAAGGSTNGGAGIALAYRIARAQMAPRGVNRVILATDGDFNVGVTSQGDLLRMIERERRSGVFLTVLGLGMGNYKDSTLEKLASRGNGNYAYIDTIAEARKVLVREAGATLVTIAKDVKIQVELNPQRVRSYRLIGYENRIMRARDFNDDAKDAGEIGAGHSVTAIYELVPATSASTPATKKVDALRYQRPRALSGAARSDELLTVKLRFKRPRGRKSSLFSTPVRDRRKALAQTSADYRFSAAVAAFGMLLRGSRHRGRATYSLVRRLVRGALGQDRHGYRRELLKLVNRAAALSTKTASR